MKSMIALVVVMFSLIPPVHAETQKERELKAELKVYEQQETARNGKWVTFQNQCVDASDNISLKPECKKLLFDLRDMAFSTTAE